MLKVDTRALAGAGHLLSGVAEGAAAAGRVAETALSAAAGAAGGGVVAGALDELGGAAVLAHQIAGQRVALLAQVARGGGQVYEDVDHHLAQHFAR